jgi:hypothetical protein
MSQDSILNRTEQVHIRTSTIGDSNCGGAQGVTTFIDSLPHLNCLFVQRSRKRMDYKN